jgi:hypothetical protein
VSIEQYRSHRANWIQTLCGEHPNSVQLQLYSACRDAAFFNLVQDLGKRAEPDELPNRRLLELFQFGYYLRQAMAVRRLVDKSGKNVSSLWRVIDKMRHRAALFSRENVVGHDGTPFDEQRAGAAYWATVDVEQIESQGGVATNPGDGVLLQRYSDCQRRNIAFDRIRIQARRPRLPGDCIPKSSFNRLLSELDSPQITRVVEMTHKFVAHAAADADPLDPGLRPTPQDLDAALRQIAQVTAFVLGPLLEERSFTPVPEPQGPHLDGLSKGLIPERLVSEARAAWRASKRRIDSWVGPDELARLYPGDRA